jgi:hypothetical protein
MANPFDAEGVGGGVSHTLPRMGHGGGEGVLDTLPSTDVSESDPDKRGESQDDAEAAVGGTYVALEGKADAQNEDNVDHYDEPVDDYGLAAKVSCGLGSLYFG